MYEELIKSLRWLAFMFPETHPAKDDADRMSNNIHLHCQLAADAIEKLQTPQWIPVTERVPNCNGCYLVWRPHFFGGEIGMPSICYFDGTNTWHDSYGVDFTRILHSEDVTHWMPLPSAPMEE